MTEEQLAYDREPIPFTAVKRLERDDILYVTEETRPHPIEGYYKAHKEYAVIDLRGYRRGYEPRLEIQGIYTSNPKDMFRLHDGHLPPYQPTTTGDKVLSEMRRMGIHSASRIAPAGAISAQTRKYWVIIEDPGDSYFTRDSAIPYPEFEEERKKILDRGGKLPTIRIRLEEPPGNGGEEYQPAVINLDVLAATDPLSKFCCRQCGECAPEELLEEGKFLERISWLRHHYHEKHPGMWGKMSPMTEGFYWTAINKDTGEIVEYDKTYPAPDGALKVGRDWVSRHWKGNTALVEVWRQPHRYSQALEIEKEASEMIPPGEIAAVIPTEPIPRPKREGDLEFIPDSPEILAQTINESGWREQLDAAFNEAMARCRK